MSIEEDAGLLLDIVEKMIRFFFLISDSILNTSHGLRSL